MKVPHDTETKRLDRLGAAEAQAFDAKSLVGSFFLSTKDDGKVNWQGCVVAEPAPGVFLVELFDWIVGDSSEQCLVPIADMATWSFYDSGEWMRGAYRDHPGRYVFRDPS